MNHYDFKKETFIINDYQKKNPFANFLPGVAGKMGIPLWVFYVNRGQGISGYGLNNKNHPIMPFTPANKAYETVETNGFRTFFKVNNTFYEPFRNDTVHAHKMMIERTAFSIEETNETLGLKTSVRYFGLPSMPIAALVRHVKVENTGDKPLDLEMIDGIAEILPSGIANESFKSTSNLLSSWMDVTHLEDDLALYVLRASTGDTSEVNGVKDGHFYIAFNHEGLIRPIVDQHLIFSYNTAKTLPIGFIQDGLDNIIASSQVTTNKIPCGFIPHKLTLKAQETFEFYALSGHVDCYNTLQSILPQVVSIEAMREKNTEAREVVETMLADVDTDTAYPMFDAYIKQSYLDNFLRGGYPIKIGKDIYHLYSRRHGDLERDYNFFSLAPEYYSQGSGNFRDVCQNRRLDTLIEKDVKDFNIRHFASLIQLDGYNPLTVDGTVYTIRKDANVKALLSKYFNNNHESLESFLQEPFTPGGIVNFIKQHHIETLEDAETYLAEIIDHSDSHIKASFGEGFWVDHFTYVLDLIETYQKVYPENLEELLYKKRVYTYFDSPVTIRSKCEKTVLNNDGKVRQYGSLRHFDKEKLNRLSMNPYISNWAMSGNVPYQSNLFTKLLILVLNKHAQLDPEGFGIEMEAEKPGWNDAMNGLPGLFGSGISETIELWRIVDFLVKNHQAGSLDLPKEVISFYQALKHKDDYHSRVQARETYRESIRFGLAGTIETIDMEEVYHYLVTLKVLIQNRLETLYESYEGVLPTFLTYSVDDYDLVKESGEIKQSRGNYQLVTPKSYHRHALAPFLEAPARLLKTSFDKDKLAKMHQRILESDMYDKTLEMFKTSAPVAHETHEIGRIHAFTPGWLERESNFLHMTYKYVLGLLKAGLYEEFYKAIETNMVCFMDPDVYGRNPLENSSFIAPTNNPDPRIHGQGFFARLTGSTVEVLNMWVVMMTGGQPFDIVEGELVLQLKPKLHKRFFKKDKTVSFNFLKSVRVTYVNESLDHTYERCDIHEIVLESEGKKDYVKGNRLVGKIASDVRDGLYKEIKIYMNKN